MFGASISDLEFEDPTHIVITLLQRLADVNTASQGRRYYSQAQQLLATIVQLLITAEPVIAGRRYRIASGVEHIATDPAVRKAREFMFTHRCEAIRGTDVARHVGLSYAALERRFLTSTDTSVLASHERFRMDRALELLAAGQSVQETSLRTGYDDPAHFSKAFKRRCGISPTFYRNAVTTTVTSRTTTAAKIEGVTGAGDDHGNVFIAVQGAVRDTLDANALISPRFWVLDYFYTKDVRVRLTGNPHEWQVDANVAHLYPPDSGYYESSRDAERPIVGIWVEFHPGAAANVARLFRDGNSFAIFRDPGKRLGGLMRRLHKRCGQNEQEPHHAPTQPLLDSMVTLLARARHVDNGTFLVPVDDAPEQVDLVGDVRRFLAARFGDTINRAALARHVSLSVSRLSHRYQELTGEGPMETLQRMRIDQAKRMLMEGTSVKETSRACGYRDPHYFSRAFRRLENMAPGRYANIFKRRL